MAEPLSPAVDDDRFHEVNGYTLRLRFRGEGGPLAVFGHGLLGSIEQLNEGQAALDALAARMRVLLYDARGHGKSAGPEDPSGYTWETLGRDMTALVDFAGDEQAILGGASMGAASALWAAIEQPEMVRALALMMPPPLGHEPMRAQAEKQAILALDMLSAMVQNFGLEKSVEIASTFPGFGATPAEAAERARFLLEQNPLAILHAVRGLLQAPFHDPEAYRTIRVPTLVLAHEGDGLHPVRAAQLLAENIADCRLRVGPEPDYWRTHPDELLAEFSDFLDYLG